jgi:hypothetical protein
MLIWTADMSLVIRRHYHSFPVGRIWYLRFIFGDGLFCSLQTDHGSLTGTCDKEDVVERILTKAKRDG